VPLVLPDFASVAAHEGSEFFRARAESTGSSIITANKGIVQQVETSAAETPVTKENEAKPSAAGFAVQIPQRLSQNRGDRDNQKPDGALFVTNANANANPKSKTDKQPIEPYKPIPVLGEITSGEPATPLEPPTDHEVMQALKCLQRQEQRPCFNERHRKDVVIIKEKIADFVDPERFYPLIGKAQLHHSHYKCTILFTERAIKDLPGNAEERSSVEVIYIDHNHFHMPGNP
jgi:hypothetical protein